MEGSFEPQAIGFLCGFSLGLICSPHPNPSTCDWGHDSCFQNPWWHGEVLPVTEDSNGHEFPLVPYTGPQEGNCSHTHLYTQELKVVPCTSPCGVVPCTSPCGVMSHTSLLLPTWCGQIHQRSNIGAVHSGWEAVLERGETEGTFNVTL